MTAVESETRKTRSTHVETRKTRSSEAFYGRRHGKALKPLQAAIRDEFLPKLHLAPNDLSPNFDLKSLFEANVSGVILEIGFGGGEHLIHRSRQECAFGFIGVEPFVNSMAKCMFSYSEQPTGNLRVYDDDATVLLDALPEGQIDRIDLLYPDPWQKTRHHKRRFVSQKNLNRFARVLKPGGLFRFASDIPHYINWTLSHCDEHPSFEWIASGPKDWHTPYDGWPSTRYEAKALREGRTPCYLQFNRV